MSLKPTSICSLALAMSLPMSAGANGFSAQSETNMRMQTGHAYEQEFIVTAYYSPLPEQSWYATGDLASDIILNGEGTHAADGTPVYSGMAAAPSTYPFGTQILLPEIGMVTVHDRGGAIREGSDTHRLDLWMGSGEEGLNRAMAFGIQRFRGTVYPSAHVRIPPPSHHTRPLPAAEKAQPKTPTLTLNFGTDLQTKIAQYVEKNAGEKIEKPLEFFSQSAARSGA